MNQVNKSSVPLFVINMTRDTTNIDNLVKGEDVLAFKTYSNTNTIHMHKLVFSISKNYKNQQIFQNSVYIAKSKNFYYIHPNNNALHYKQSSIIEFILNFSPYLTLLFIHRLGIAHQLLTNCCFVNCEQMHYLFF